LVMFPRKGGHRTIPHVFPLTFTSAKLNRLRNQITRAQGL
jgi:hypothetical protein